MLPFQFILAIFAGVSGVFGDLIFNLSAVRVFGIAFMKAQQRFIIGFQ